MRKGVLLSAIMVGFLSLAVYIVLSHDSAQVDAQEVPLGALVIDDSSWMEGTVSSDALVSKLIGSGWEVTVLESVEIEFDTSGDFPGIDVVFVSSATSPSEIHRLTGDGGALDHFARHGGVVVILDLAPESLVLDIAPGGADAESIDPVTAGAVTATDPTHPLITGAGTTEVALSDTDLDPSGSGGSGITFNIPSDAVMSVIASNADGAVLVEYSIEFGSVLICCLANPSENCIDNILSYSALMTQ